MHDATACPVVDERQPRLCRGRATTENWRRLGVSRAWAGTLSHAALPWSLRTCGLALLTQSWPARQHAAHPAIAGGRYCTPDRDGVFASRLEAGGAAANAASGTRSRGRIAA